MTGGLPVSVFHEPVKEFGKLHRRPGAGFRLLQVPDDR